MIETPENPPMDRPTGKESPKAPVRPRRRRAAPRSNKKRKGAGRAGRAGAAARRPLRRNKAVREGHLNPREARFVEEFLLDLNATQATIRAGYGRKGADVQGIRLLGNVRVAKAVEIAMAERSLRTRITADQVLIEIGRLAYSDIGNIATWSDKGVRWVNSDQLTPDERRCVAEIGETITTLPSGAEQRKMKVKLHSKPQALQLLMRHLGLLGDTRKGGFDEKTFAAIVDGVGSMLRELVPDDEKRIEAFRRLGQLVVDLTRGKDGTFARIADGREETAA